MRLRWFVGLTSALLAAANACDSFSSDPSSTLDGGTPTEGGPSAPAPDCATRCASQRCEADGGCDPLVFVTPDRYQGDLGADGGPGGVPLGDEICQKAAGSRPGTFRAWLSTKDVTAGTWATSGAGADRPLFLADGKTRVGASYRAILADGGLEHAISLTAQGGTVQDGDHVWTGTNAAGGWQMYDCYGWRNGSALAFGEYGVVNLSRVDAGPGEWTVNAPATFCNLRAHLYCFEVIP